MKILVALLAVTAVAIALRAPKQRKHSSAAVLKQHVTDELWRDSQRVFSELGV